MKFSVLLPVYKGNTIAEFAAAVNSVLQQTLLPDEVVIVRDGDASEAIESYLQELERNNPTVKVLRLPLHSGIGVALNEGLKHCTYDWVARMDADDISVPDRFEKSVKFVEQHIGKYALVGGYYAEKPAPGKEYIRKVPTDSSHIAEFSKYRTPHSHPTVFYRKSIIQEVGGYKNYFFAEDWYLWLRMYAKGYKTANLPEVLVYTHAENYTRRLGIEALKNDIRLFKGLYKEKLIGWLQLAINVAVRGVVRLLPVGLAHRFYHKFLRNAKTN